MSQHELQGTGMQYQNASYLGAITGGLNQHLWALLACCFFILASYRIFRSWWRLRHVPGPFWASLSDLPRVYWVTTREAHLIHQNLHQKYGPVVRVGPNTVIFDNPDAIPIVYPVRPGIPKADFYAVLRPYQRGGTPLKAVFNTQDESLHKLIKSPIAPLFSFTNAVAFENLIDEVLTSLKLQFDDRFSKTSEVFDLGDWLVFFSFDVMGAMTFSKQYGFIDQGKDVGNMIGAIHTFMKTVAPMTQAFWLDKILYKNAVADYIRRAPGLEIMKFVGNVIKERREKIELGDKKAIEQQDFLGQFLNIQRNNPNLPPWASTAWTFSNVTAGSDSVGTVMRTTIYHLLSNPASLHKLETELQSANLTLPFPRHSEVRNLPYLDACIWEASRMHPPFALPLERVVPEGGLQVLGFHLPGGTVVGGSPYAVNRHKGTFGEDAEFWRPERWLENGDDHFRHLERSILTFGSGRRICLGKHVGILEIKKLVAFLLINYKIRILDPRAFQVENVWFFRQRGLYVQIEKK